MNANTRFWTVLVLVSILLTACNMGSTTTAVSPTFVATPTPFQPSAVASSTHVVLSPTAESAQSDSFQFVERPVTVTPQVTGKIDWNEQLVINGWVELSGLYPNVKLYYNQSAVGKVQTVENIEVKPGAELIFGAVEANIEVKDLATGKIIKLTRGGGVYGTIPSGLLIVKMIITDGFMAMAAASDAQNEFCARVAQTYAEHWALTTTFPNPTWIEPICTGTYKVPVDSDRLNGGSLPYVPTAKP